MNAPLEHPMVPPTDNPLLDYLGIRLASVGDGRCAFELDIEPRHLNRQGSVQGGVIATLLDAACGYAGLPMRPDGALGHAVTVMLAISYLSRASAGRLRATATVSRAGRSLYFASAELAIDAGVLVATAQGTFKRSHVSAES
ncbi:PaaI family thioesterase [Cupriavidus neocaledonicus]|uniref:ABC transporter substrate-binding protein n=2 Tax=Cupriavidus neocaledonicus TaxID=1040979 RepID=A0A375HRK5_9BURK|nr:PaaI family thioesterase [Cupriavidus neocaledonicus]SOZ38873.1 ABC transporter substrate-binding protein [Cupriavidus neocaledonicus]SPD59484.1 ABC transporter substrate-binding protein [Cupriavidus neocaledonicus]